MKLTKEISGHRFQDLDFNQLVDEGVPVIARGALKDAPLVAAGLASRNEAIAHLLAHADDQQVINYTSEPDAGGRFFYRPSMDGFNFTTEVISIPTFFEKLETNLASCDGRALYVCSVDADKSFSSLLSANAMELNTGIFETHRPRAGVWLGNRTIAATHFDVSNNVAACMVGKRRFTLFPPDQIANLYPGPLEPTPGGQTVSMFDINNPDLDRFPRAAQALETAQVAELEPGDVLVYPAMWWHQVEALADFNLMINFWWNLVPEYIDDPEAALLNAMLSLRDRPAHEKQAWRHLFDYYVFGDADQPRAHLPEHVWGALAPMSEQTSRRVRLQLMKKINR